ncbi:homeobox-leucine zipper protein ANTHOCYANINLESS [Trifolium repens]|nr:homeobox-leucine zipper protein ANTHOCYANINLESS [Trifolium repens]
MAPTICRCRSCDECQLRVENARLKNELARVSALAAMQELITMAEPDSDLWIKNPESGKEEFNHVAYERIRSPFNTARPNGFVTEATRETLLLCTNSAALIETFLDADRWAEMFPCMIVEAETLDVFSNGIDGINGSIQLMHAEIQLPSPLVPVREYNFIRFCKQHAEGKWAVVDVSFDYGRNSPNGNPNISCKKLPSGCILQDMPNVVCPIGKRIMSKLARQMSDYLWSGICPSSDSDWDILLTTDMGNSDLKITSQEIQDAYGANPSIILSASTSVWMPVSRQRVFDFLRDARRRSEWDVLSNGVSMEEMVRVATGEGIGNSVSILRGHNAANGIYLQDSWTDSSCSMVVYSPISMQSLDMLMDGGDSSFVALLPSGFSILPDGYSNSNTGTSSDDSGSSDNDNSGCLLTVGFQMLLTNESFDTIYELMSHTIEKIKDALEVE